MFPNIKVYINNLKEAILLERTMRKRSVDMMVLMLCKVKTDLQTEKWDFSPAFSLLLSLKREESWQDGLREKKLGLIYLFILGGYLQITLGGIV